MPSDSQHPDPPPASLILGTAGHIDHGKTALIRQLTGIETDRLPDEKKRGITIDLGFAWLDLPGYRLGIVDVPGHERFVKNMLAGATGSDLVMLVVAADDSVMPQTREHMAICQLLDLHNGVIAITKADLADDHQLQKVRQDIGELVKGTFLESVPVVETSVVDGRGIDTLKATLGQLCQHAPRRRASRMFRLAIDRSFHLAGMGTVVSGTVWSGRVAAGDRLAWLPGGGQLRVRSVQVHGQKVEQASAGQRAAINLADVHHHQIQRGHELASPGYLRPGSLVLAHVHLLPQSPYALKHRQRVRVHTGTTAVTAMANLFQTNQLEPGQSAWVQLLCGDPIATEPGQPLVLRHESPVHTIGGGHAWWQPDRRITRRQFSEIVESLVPLQSDDAYARMVAAIRLYGPKPWQPIDLYRDARIESDAVEVLLKRAVDEGVLVNLADAEQPGMLIHRQVAEQLDKQIIEQVDRLHQSQPDQPMLSRSQVVARLAKFMPKTIIDVALNRMIRSGALCGDDRQIASPSHQAHLTARQRDLAEQIKRLTSEAGLSFLDETNLLEQTHGKESDLKTVLKFMENRGVLTHLGDRCWIDRNVLNHAIEQLRQAFADQPRLTTPRIRDILGTTRRYVMPICEYLDALGITCREGNERRWAGTDQHD